MIDKLLRLSIFKYDNTIHEWIHQQNMYKNPQLQSYKPLSDFQVSRVESTRQLQTRHWKEPEYLLHEDFLQVSSQVYQHRTGD